MPTTKKAPAKKADSKTKQKDSQRERVIVIRVQGNEMKAHLENVKPIEAINLMAEFSARLMSDELQTRLRSKRDNKDGTANPKSKGIRSVATNDKHPKKKNS